MAKLLLWIFRAPGNAACDALGVAGDEDRMMLRTLVDMLFWNVVVVVGAALLFA